MRNRRFLVPKITQVELNGRISKTLTALGAAHHIQAVFFGRVALETLASRNLVLTALHPSVRDGRALAWSIAFQVVEELLQATAMSLTLETVNHERIDRRKKMNIGVITHLYGKENFFGQLLRSTEKRRALPLRDRIALICPN
jgi:hypothetical protein